MPHTFEDLVTLEQAAEAAHARYTAPGADHDTARQEWRDAAETFQAAVTEYAAAQGTARIDVEMAAKKAVRHAAAAS